MDACKVDESFFGQVLDSCDCNDRSNPSCQLQLEGKKIICKETANSECRSAVKGWADAYKVAGNSQGIKCKETENYKRSQAAGLSCSSGKNIHLRMLKRYIS